MSNDVENTQNPVESTSKPVSEQNRVASGEWEMVPMSGLIAGIAFAIARENMGASSLLVAGLAYAICIQNGNFRFNWLQKFVATGMMLVVGTYWRQLLNLFSSH